MKKFEGQCIGGPRDGQQMAWTTNRRVVEVRERPTRPLTQNEFTRIRTGTYVFQGGAWRWSEASA